LDFGFAERFFRFAGLILVDHRAGHERAFGGDLRLDVNDLGLDALAFALALGDIIQRGDGVGRAVHGDYDSRHSRLIPYKYQTPDGFGPWDAGGRNLYCATSRARRGETVCD